MGTTVQARLDKETLAEMNAFLSRKGWSTSKTVREAIRLLVRHESGSAASRLVGLGIIDSGPGDMATNKKYLEGLGRNSGIDGTPKARRRRKAS
jgi:hypothetical protein